MSDIPEEFLDFLRKELRAEKLAEGFARVATPDGQEMRVEVTPEQAQRIIANPATSYGMGEGIIVEAPSAEHLRNLPGADAFLIFPASSHWLQEEEDPEWLAGWNSEGVPSRPGIYKFRLIPK